jgi:hypothetical protein
MDGEALARLRANFADLAAIAAERPGGWVWTPAADVLVVDALIEDYDALRAERAPAAAVLAAADDWVRGHRGTLNGCPGCVALSLAVVAWRAARGETG